MSFDAPGLKCPGNQLRCRSFLVAQFGVCMNGSSEGLDFAVGGLDFWDKFHDRALVLCFAWNRSGLYRPGTLIPDSTPKAFLAALHGPTASGRNKIQGRLTAYRSPGRITNECSD